jgi:N-acetyl-anhydromuramyl-L-alanine amidase AmpD
VVAALCRAYPSLRPTRLAGHSDVAPGRKSDPGVAFDWTLAHRCIAAAARRRRLRVYQVGRTVIRITFAASRNPRESRHSA